MQICILLFASGASNTFACKAVTINGTPVTEENQAVSAPDFDPTKGAYKIESSYDEEFTYALNLDVSSSYASAKFVVLKDIELWSYEAEVPEKHVTLLPKKRYDMDFEDVSTKVPIIPLRFLNIKAKGIIPDPELDQIVRGVLGLDFDDPPTTRADVKRLTHLSASYRSIRSISGLQHAVNLRTLDLSNSSISELPGLSKLKKLESLNIDSNPLSKVSLSNLPNLTELRLRNNTLSEVSLSNLKSLKYLVVESSTISKLSLSNLPSLHTVNEHRRIGSWGPLPFERPLDMNLSHLGISELSLSKLKNLKELDLSDNHLSDLSFLKEAKNLTHLNLSNNGISDLVFPEVFSLNNPKLILLNLSNNLLTTESAILVSSFPDLKYLDLSYNRISDPLYIESDVAPNTYTALHTALASNINLTHLNLDNNLLSGILHLHPDSFQHLVDLHLNNNQFSEVSLSGGPRNLKLIRLKNNPVSKVSLSDLPNFTHFASIIEPGSHLSEVSLSDIPNLIGLSLGACPLLSKVSLSDLPKLEDLYIIFNPLLSEVSLAGIPNLKYLRAWHNSLLTLSLPELPNLTELYLANNTITDVSGLSNLTNLTKLELGNNLISDVSGLSNLTNLTELYLANNTITDVSGLSNLTNLTKLELGNNLISDVTPLSNLTNLAELELSNNFISDVTPLSNLTNLSTWSVRFSNNPLNPDSLRTYRKAIGMVFSPPSDLPVLIKISGDDQIGAPSETLPNPFVVQALDEKEQPVSGASIRFFVYEGEGTIRTRNTTDVVTTDTTGKAEATLTLGPNPGPNRVAAIGYDGFKASFTATATLDEGTPGQIAEGANAEDAANIQAKNPNGNDATNIQAENPNGDDAANIQAEDVNSDGVVNIQDLVFISSHLGQTGGHAADVSGDGVVDVRDLVRVSATLR